MSPRNVPPARRIGTWAAQPGRVPADVPAAGYAGERAAEPVNVPEARSRSAMAASGLNGRLNVSASASASASAHAPSTSSSTPMSKPMRQHDLERVLAIEVCAYSFPWSRGNFADSLLSGHIAQMLVHPQHDELLGYWVAMPCVDELHLLNLTVAPTHQRKGHARHILGLLTQQAQALALPALLLEVRASNEAALALYASEAFTRIGLRRSYYPAARGRREDAVVMRRTFDAAPQGPDQSTRHDLD